MSVYPAFAGPGPVVAVWGFRHDRSCLRWAPRVGDRRGNAHGQVGRAESTGPQPVGLYRVRCAAKTAPVAPTLPRGSGHPEVARPADQGLVRRHTEAGAQPCEPALHGST